MRARLRKIAGGSPTADHSRWQCCFENSGKREDCEKDPQALRRTLHDSPRQRSRKRRPFGVRLGETVWPETANMRPQRFSIFEREGLANVPGGDCTAHEQQ